MTKKRTSMPAVPASASVETAFAEVVGLIQAARGRTWQAVNAELIDLYWRIGEYLHHRIAADGWAQGTVVQLAAYIAQREPGVRGFSAQNLWRMRQFFEAYRDEPILSSLLRVLPWTHNLIILGQAKRPDEREFYLRQATEDRWPVHELERQIRAALFERATLNSPKVSAALKQLQPRAESDFKDAYLLEFLGHLVELRNGIRHSRTVDEVTRKEGEAAILWFKQVLGK